MANRLLRLLGSVAYAGLVLVVFVLTAYFAFNLFVRSGVTHVPDLAGLTDQEATALASDQGLALRVRPEDNAYDDRIAPGKILRQRPGAGSLVKRGAIVEVVLSRGPQRVAVPDVVGQAAQAAQLALAAAGLQPGQMLSVYTSGQGAGLVAMQNPPGGSLVSRAAPVDLYLSIDDPAQTFVMPDLVYRGYDEVKKFFEPRGFKLGNVKFEPYEGIADGVVLRQFPLPGHPLHRRDAIALVVAGAGT